MTTDILKDYIIYKIYCKDEKIIDEYYGHTCAFRGRKNVHKNCCFNENRAEYNQEKYKIIRSNGGWNNWVMSPIEELKNCSLINAKIREQFHIDLNKCNINIKKSYVTEEQKKERNNKNNKERYQNNKENILEKSKERYQNNKENILEKSKEKMTCACGSTFRIYAKARHEQSKKHCEFIK
jgi:hypothetical protein